MPPNPNFGRVPGATTPAPRSTPRLRHPSEFEPTESELLRQELARSRIALERMEKRQRFSVGRVVALLVLIGIIFVVVVTALA
jgi:hypothetical protein